MTDPSFYAQPGLHTEIYDVMTGRTAAVHEDVTFFDRYTPMLDGPTLELACGTGRVAWALAALGHDVVGVDLSPAMLAIAEGKRPRMSGVLGSARFAQGNMASFSLNERFRLVVIPFRSFQALLTPELQQQSLARIHAHLLPGGRLIIDLFDPRLDMCLPGRSETPQPRDTVVHPTTGRTVEVTAVYRENDAVNQVLEERWRLAERDADGSVVREEFETLRLRWTYRHEARHLFERSGFRVLAEYSDFVASPPTYGREQVWVLERPT